MIGPTALNVLLILLAILQLVMIIRLFRNYHHTPRLIPRQEPAVPVDCRVSVVIPARNEERNLPVLLQSLCRQTHFHAEFLVVDDESEDGTAAIVRTFECRDPRVRLIPGKPRPESWRGKNWAVHQGAGAARSEWLLFLDADTELHPQAIAVAVAQAEKDQADLLTLIPHVRFSNFAERLVQPMIMQLLLVSLSGRRISDPESPEVSANGPFLLFRTEAYRAIGGHQAIREDVVEDLTLAKRIKAHGYRLRYYNGQELQNLQMYDSFGALWRGWSKNFFDGFDRSGWKAALGMLALFLQFVFPWLLLPVILPAVFLSGFAWPWLIALILTTDIVIGQIFLRLTAGRLYRMESAYFWLQPAAALIVIAIIANSARIGLTGGTVLWRGKA